MKYEVHNFDQQFGPHHMIGNDKQWHLVTAEGLVPQSLSIQLNILSLQKTSQIQKK